MWESCWRVEAMKKSGIATKLFANGLDSSICAKGLLLDNKVAMKISNVRSEAWGA